MRSLDRRHPALPIVIVLTLLVAIAPSLAARWQDTGDKTIFVSVVDKQGKPVTDFTADSFVVNENNVDLKVKSATLSKQPLYVEFLADTSSSVSDQGAAMAATPGSRTGTTAETGMALAGQGNLIQDMRKSTIAFAQTLFSSNPDNQMALMEFGQAAITIQKLTSKAPDVEKAINKLFPKLNSSSVLSEAIIDAATDLSKAAGRRRAIVIVNVEPGVEESQQQPAKMDAALRKGGASLWAVSLQQGTIKNPAHDVVLNALAQQTGGHREVIVGQSGIGNILKDYIAILNAQYEITYTRVGPPGKNPMRVGVRADGMKLYASLYPPE